MTTNKLTQFNDIKRNLKIIDKEYTEVAMTKSDTINDIICDKCQTPLTELGGLAFSPPTNGMTIKYHLCKKCWREFLKWMI